LTTLPDPAPSSTDNPWLQLILDSNQKDPDNPTAYWNAMQNCISRNFGVVATLDDIETVYERLDKDEVKAFYNRLSKAEMVGEINFKNVIFDKVDFTGARFF